MWNQSEGLVNVSSPEVCSVGYDSYGNKYRDIINTVNWSKWSEMMITLWIFSVTISSWDLINTTSHSSVLLPLHLESKGWGRICHLSNKIHLIFVGWIWFMMNFFWPISLGFQLRSSKAESVTYFGLTIKFRSLV